MLDEQQKSFDAIPTRYESARPAPPAVMFDVLEERVPPPADALEIGCGPGNASVFLAERQYRLHAVELGLQLAARARLRLAGFPFSVEVGRFESMALARESVDLVYASSAFHWLSLEPALNQVAHVLKPGGTVALSWTSAGRELEDPDLGPRLRELHVRHTPELVPDPAALSRSAIDAVGAALGADTRFLGFEEVRFVEPLHYDSAGFIDLLRTYSDHAVLAPGVAGRLEAAIAELIDTQFRGQVVRKALTRLLLARRR